MNSNLSLEVQGTCLVPKKPRDATPTPPSPCMTWHHVVVFISLVSCHDPATANSQTPTTAYDLSRRLPKRGTYLTEEDSTSWHNIPSGDTVSYVHPSCGPGFDLRRTVVSMLPQSLMLLLWRTSVRVTKPIGILNPRDGSWGYYISVFTGLGSSKFRTRL
jgi:hypothetical protein